MKPKTMILMVVAVACGLGASYMTSRLLAERNQQPAENTVKVLVARQKLTAWTLIKEPDKAFEVKEIPESAVPKKALGDLAKVQDQRLNKTVEEGKMVTEDDLLNKEQAGLAAQMKPGERAVAIRVTPESSAAGFVLPGSRVDVVATIRGADSASKIILQDMLVLAVDAQAQRNPEQPHILGQTVTVAAKPEEATRLTLAASLGELRLILRPLGDTATVRRVVSKAADLDRPLAREGTPAEEETRPTGSGGLASLPADLGPEPAAPTPAPAVEQPKPRVKRHRMTIRQGANTEKAVFVLGQKEDDEEGDVPGVAPRETKPEPRPQPKPEPKAATPAPKPAPPPPSPFGARSTRTGRIK
jgi:pilus assembly protein CpaB